MNIGKSLNPIKKKIGTFMNLFKKKNKEKNSELDKDYKDDASDITEPNSDYDEMDNESNITFTEVVKKYANIITSFIKLLNEPGFINILDKYSKNINSIDLLKIDTDTGKIILKIDTDEILKNNSNLIVELIEWFIFDYNHNFFMIDLLTVLQSFIANLTTTKESLTTTKESSIKMDLLLNKVLEKTQSLGTEVERISTEIETSKKNGKDIDLNKKAELDEYSSRYTLMFAISYVYMDQYSDPEKRISLNEKFEEKNNLINEYRLALKCLIDNFLIFFKQHSEISKGNNQNIDPKDTEKNLKIKRAIHFLIEYAFGIYSESSFLIFIDNMAGLSELYVSNVANCEVFVIVAFTQFILKAITLDNISLILKSNIDKLTGIRDSTLENANKLLKGVQQQATESLNRINEVNSRHIRYVGNVSSNAPSSMLSNVWNKIIPKGGKNKTQKKKRVLHRSRKIRR